LPTPPFPIPDPVNGAWMWVLPNAPHYLQLGVSYAIFITGYTSNSATVDAYINSPDGLMTNPIDADDITWNTITLRSAFEPYQPGPSNTRFTLVIGVRRILIPLKFRVLSEDSKSTQGGIYSV
jgi:hypothetical protein